MGKCKEILNILLDQSIKEKQAILLIDGHIKRFDRKNERTDENIWTTYPIR